jgi:hypothetical protein
MYISLDTPETMLSSTCCILGNPKAGKTTLSKGVIETIDSVHLTPPLILQSILDGNDNTVLCETVCKE